MYVMVHFAFIDDSNAWFVMQFITPAERKLLCAEILCCSAIVYFRTITDAVCIIRGSVLLSVCCTYSLVFQLCQRFHL